MSDMSKFKVGAKTYDIKDEKSRGVPLTWAQYQALSYEEQHNGTAYYITDMDAIYPVDHELNANSRNAVANDIVTPHILAMENVLGAKNLAPILDFTQKVEQGITWTVIRENGSNNGKVTVVGTASAWSIVSTKNVFLPAGSYILSAGVSDIYHCYVQLNNVSDSSLIATTYGEFSVSFELTNDAELRLLYVVYEGSTVNDAFACMIRPAGTDPTYVPYAMTNEQLTGATELLTGNAPNDITARVSNLPTAVAQQNLEKYGYKIGDYFDGSVSGYRYWLGHLDYNYGGYNSYGVLGSHNIGLVVDTKSNSQWNTSNDTTGGYESSVLHTYLKGTVLDNIKADLKSLFGSSTGLEHLIAESKLFASIPDWEWSSSAEYISALTEVNVYGCPIWSVDKFQQGEADQQLEIFRKYKYNRIFGNNNIWLRSISSASEACFAYGRGHASGVDASLSLGAAGLIIFH